MLIARDVYTQADYFPIVFKDGGQRASIVQYEVRSYTDTRNLANIKGYLVTCTQRLVLPNPNPFALGSTNIQSFGNYPGLISNSIAVTDSQNVLGAILLTDYSPRTINAAVSTNKALDSTSATNMTRDYTSGSSVSQTNTFGVSGSAGGSAEGPTGSLGFDASVSTTHDRFQQLAMGGSIDRGTQLSNSDATTIKDWGCVASVDLGAQSPTWTWAQEYPWNIVQLNTWDPTSSYIMLPQYVQDRLYDQKDGILYPPSDLASFGVDFIAKATWFLLPGPAFTGVEPISFVHTLSYAAASHAVTASTPALQATLDVFPSLTHTSKTLDLPLLALDPLATNNGRAGIVGFLPNKFDVAPTANGTIFASTSDTNDLLVRGTGFNGALSTDFTVGAPQMTLYFKVLDNTADLSLSIKHWTDNNTAVQLSIAINGNPPVTKFADAPQTSSGGDNVTTIALRNRDFTSVDYCDWLQPGLNQVVISFSNANAAASPFYQVLAVAIE
jgi:hypothetical protein